MVFFFSLLFCFYYFLLFFCFLFFVFLQRFFKKSIHLAEGVWKQVLSFRPNPFCVIWIFELLMCGAFLNFLQLHYSIKKEVGQPSRFKV